MAFYRNKYTDNPKIIRSLRHNDYETKKEFQIDLQGNGFTVIRILTIEEVEMIKKNKPSQINNISDRLMSYIKEVY